MPLLTLLLACSAAPADKAPADDTAGDTSHDTSGETGESGDSVETGETASPDRPVLLTVDAFCYEHTTGETFWNWEAHCTATDPQGTDTLERGGTLTVLTGGAPVATYTLAVNPDTGECTGSFREDADGVLCSAAASYTFRFVVEDEDDHLSDPMEVAGRRQ